MGAGSWARLIPMATAKPQRIPPTGMRPHRLRKILLALVALSVAIVALFWHQLQAQALVAASYGARIACTCHYIAGRGLDDCRKDFEPGMALVMLSENAAAHAIVARVPLLATQTATVRNGSGCLLQTWTP